MVESKGIPGDDLLSQRLADLEAAKRYYSWISDLLLPFLGSNPLEIGSGRGEHAKLWLDRGLPRVTVTDSNYERLEHLSRRFRDDSRVTVRSTGAVPRQPVHSSVVSINVLEHISNDVAALSDYHSMVQTEGKLVLLVPAFPMLLSAFDKQLGHYRRYKKRDLRGKVEAAGFRVTYVGYVNAPGFLAWLILYRVLDRPAAEGGLLRLWDRCVVPVARHVERYVKTPFGQSLILVAAKD